MNRVRLLAIGTLLMFALAMLAQQTTTKPGGSANGASGDASAQGGTHGRSVPSAEGQLKVLTEKLDLTGDQQAKVKPILQELHDDTQKLMRDQSLSREELLDKVRPLRMKADKKIREILSDDQKKKLDQYEQGAHPEMHGDLHG